MTKLQNFVTALEKAYSDIGINVQVTMKKSSTPFETTILYEIDYVELNLKKDVYQFITDETGEVVSFIRILW